MKHFKIIINPISNKFPFIRSKSYFLDILPKMETSCKKMFQKNYGSLSSYKTVYISWLLKTCYCSSVTSEYTKDIILHLLSHFPLGKKKFITTKHNRGEKSTAREWLFYYHHLYVFQLTFSWTFIPSHIHKYI